MVTEDVVRRHTRDTGDEGHEEGPEETQQVHRQDHRQGQDSGQRQNQAASAWTTRSRQVHSGQTTATLQRRRIFSGTNRPQTRVCHVTDVIFMRGQVFFGSLFSVA